VSSPLDDGHRVEPREHPANRAGAGENARTLKADAAIRAGNNDGLACELRHTDEAPQMNIRRAGIHSSLLLPTQRKSRESSSSRAISSPDKQSRMASAFDFA
jgi:hypothetical protein